MYTHQGCRTLHPVKLLYIPTALSFKPFENSLFGTTNLNSMGISASLVPSRRVTWNLSPQNSMYDPSKLNSPFIPPSKEDPLQNLSVAGPLYQELLVQPNQDKLPVHLLPRQH